ncbi:CynX/NimT family MFS transporter [Haloglycomyces albus]|uniref:CynX/NimT family MFS transporter n=1 Tax=Haloglycomyces albus TaxID=526067 RepID=UPI00046C9B61|nr:MFS transporter [Haloglycomyces albus]
MVTQAQSTPAQEAGERNNRPAGGYARPFSAAAWVLIAGIVLATFNFRTAITSVGAVLPEIQRALGMSETLAGVLTTLPVIAFAFLGALTPRFMRQWGAKAVMSGSLLVMGFGLLARVSVDGPLLFLVFSACALAGGAVGNVAVPGIVKQYFPSKIGPLMTTYSVSLAVGTAIAAATTVPIHDMTDSWAFTLAIWALPALLAASVWLVWPQPAAAKSGGENAKLDGVLRTKLAWMFMLFFGGQASIAYIGMGWLPRILRYNGLDAHEAGALFGLYTLVVIVPSMVVPMLAASRGSQRLLFVCLSTFSPLGLLGLWFIGGPLTWLWVVLFGFGMGMFPLALTLFTLRARTPAGTEALSAFTQSAGYLMAGLGPFAVGALFGASGGFDLPFMFMFVLIAVQVVAGFYVSGNRYVEDEIAAAR